MSGFNITKQFRDDINKLKDKYTPVNGCDNCWGDLHQGCTEKCRNEFKLSREFDKDIVDLITKVANGANSKLTNCAIFDVMPMLRNVHKMLEVDFDEQTDENKELMSDIVEMCQNIADDYWMYKRE